jgi:predicted NAD/FAD-binding protein
MLRGVCVLAGESVVRVQRDSGSIVVESEFVDGTHRSESFDRIVMACDAPAALGMLGECVGRLTRFLLRRIVYVDDCEGADFLQGWIHRDESVFSAEGKKRVREMSNAVSVTRSGEVVNTFVLSSWIPKVLGLRLEESEKPFLVTYGKVPIADPIQQVSFRFAHPMLCFTNIVASFLLRFVHQPTQIAFCGSWTTPGNGHDLSLCSGLAAAHSLGAAYPFAGDKTLVEEFARVRSVVGQ